MVMMVLWGHISPQLLQKVMALFHADLLLHKEGQLDTNGIEKLKGLGSKGSHPEHCWRDLKHLLPVPRLGKLFRLMLPMKHNTLGQFRHSVPMLLPHTLFAGIYEHFPLMWEKIIYGSIGTCRKFWAAVRGSPQFAAHPVRHRVGFEEKCIPLKIHGDGTPVTGLGKGWGKMVDITSVSSLLICGPTILRNLMMFLMFQHLICRDPDHCTLDTFYMMLIWSFKWCWLGKKPTHDWNGKKCLTLVLVMICVVVSTLLFGPSSRTWSMPTQIMTCQTLLPMRAALFAQWALCLVLSGLIFVPLLLGWSTSTLFSLGWLEVSRVCYSNLAGLTFIRCC